MSGILDIYDRLSRCYEKPTLRLLTNKWAQVSVAIFTDAFPDPSCGKGTELMHAQVDAYLREFADAGVEVPLRENGARSITGRELCQERWMREDRWLAIYPLDTGETEYRLTADAIEAMEIMDKLSSTAILLSSPRMDRTGANPAGRCVRTSCSTLHTRRVTCNSARFPEMLCYRTLNSRVLGSGA